MPSNKFTGFIPSASARARPSQHSNCCTIAVIRPPVHVHSAFSYINTFTQWGCSCLEYSSVSIMKYSLERVFIYNFVKYKSWRILLTNFWHEIWDISENELLWIVGHVFMRCAACKDIISNMNYEFGTTSLCKSTEWILCMWCC